MKALFENIIKATPSNTRNYIISQLQQLANKLKSLEESNDRYQQRINGINPEQYENYLEKCIDLLKLHGYTLAYLTSYNYDFLQFMQEHALGLEKYKAKQITFETLNDLQQAYFMYCIEFSNPPENYIELRNHLLKIADGNV